MNIFKVFQERDLYFENLSKKEEGKKYLLQQTLAILLFTFLYGAVMGSYNSWMQALVTGIKIPGLIFLALFISFPVFYVIQYMLGSKMTVLQMINMTLSGFIVFSTIMLSFSPIVVFFMITGNNYSFLKLLHVAIMGFSGIFGMKVILDALRYSCEKSNIYPKVGLKIFKFWVVVFAFVGVQLAWNLRPFVGAKELPFELFREKEGNFYLAVAQSFSDMFTTKEKGNKTGMEEEENESANESTKTEDAENNSAKGHTIVKEGDD